MISSSDRFGGVPPTARRRQLLALPPPRSLLAAAAAVALRRGGTATTPPPGPSRRCRRHRLPRPRSPSPVDTPNANRAAPTPSRSPSPSPARPPARPASSSSRSSATTATRTSTTTTRPPTSSRPAATGPVAATSGVILEVTRVDKWKPRSTPARRAAGCRSRSRATTASGITAPTSKRSTTTSSRVYGSRRRGARQGRRDRRRERLPPALRLLAGLRGHRRLVDQRGVIWPWRYLDSWRKGGDKSPVAEITAWQNKHGCPDQAAVDP